MFEINLNGQIKKFDRAISGSQLLCFLDDSVRKNCLALKINGELCDISQQISSSCNIEFIMDNTEEGLNIVRHDAAHIMAQAVKQLFPHAQIVIGPTIENGFYYDFANIEPLNEVNLREIERVMQEIIKQDLPINKKTVSKKTAIEFFQKQQEFYKVEIINNISEIEQISIYTQGDFTDLCRGPHSPSTSSVKAFKLMKVSGSYWRGDTKNTLLQRVYGTAWSDKKQLKQYLLSLEEAARRDHRVVGKQMDLFHFQEQAQGSVFWHPQGWKLFLIMIDYMRKQQDINGYLEINTPEIMAQELWKKSGHWDKFRNNMFISETQEKSILYAVRPMNCPGGVQIFKQGITSYRDLPLRLSEFGKVHRYEPSGALYGLMRARSFTQDDAHIYCTPEQVTDECIKVCQLVLKTYQDFGFKDIVIKFSDRAAQRIGKDSIWDKSEQALLTALDKQKLEYVVSRGESAFYGPKLEFILHDAIGRDWQMGTVQVDFNLPERFDLHYVDKHGEKIRPIMLHRALFGSIERFIGILLEHYSGRLPLWIAPTQVVVATISETANQYAQKLYTVLQRNKIRCIIDIGNEKISRKIRTHSLRKVPIIAIIGHEEVINKTITLRKINQKNQEVLEFDQFVDKLLHEVKKRSLK